MGPRDQQVRDFFLFLLICVLGPTSPYICTHYVYTYIFSGILNFQSRNHCSNITIPVLCIIWQHQLSWRQQTDDNLQEENKTI